MVNHLKDLQELAHSLNKVGAFSDDAVKRADARARAQELRGKMWKVQAMTGADIKEMRDRLGLSQAFLAEIVNMSVESVSKWERGEKKQMAQLCGHSTRWIAMGFLPSLNRLINSKPLNGAQEAKTAFAPFLYLPRVKADADRHPRWCRR